METVHVEAQKDFIETLCRTRPLTAIAELIWNGLDADARRVDVNFQHNSMSGVEEIRVKDNGHGIGPQEAKIAFKNLGGSWKRGQNRTKGEKRYLHGKEGKGRFRAFALGKNVLWNTFVKNDERTLNYSIHGALEDPTKFKITDSREVSQPSTGTDVVITNPHNHIGEVVSENAPRHIAERFALYLRQYPHVQIVYRGENINPSSVENHVADYSFECAIEGQEQPVAMKLTVIEWKNKTERLLLLCDEQGFALQEIKPGIHARGFNFTAYLRSNYLRGLYDEGLLDMDDLPVLHPVIDATKKKLREHFREREAELAGSLIDEWKQQKIYPYEGDPAGPVETAERQVFDVLALNINEYLPDFGEIELQNKKLTLRLLRHALETRPSTIVKILEDVVKLPIEKQEEFAELLRKTSLDAIITASKVVTDRLDFLQGFNTFLFEPESRKAVLERQHLQQILVREPWIFGEMFNLAQQEATLTDVLRRHYELLGKDDEVVEEVERLDGTKGRIDLMFGAVIPYPEQDKRVHLVVELKRPSIAIGLDAMNQVESYAEAVVNDSRFRDTNTQWEFYAISNDIADRVRTHSNQPNKPQGLYLEHPDYPLRIWTKKWGQIIEACEARLRFFKERLDYSPSHSAGVNYMRKAHTPNLPSVWLHSDERKEQPD